MEEQTRPFPFFGYSVFTWGQFGLLLGAMAWLFPGVWHAQLQAGWLRIAVTFLAGCLFLCFFEYIFHRYVLHGGATLFWYAFKGKHHTHHGLTKIRAGTRPGDPQWRIRDNRYPITQPEQSESSSFPAYALIGFWAYFTTLCPVIPILQWLFPGWPIALGGYAAIVWTLYLYEVWHAIEHLSFEAWWQPRFSRGLFGRWLKWVYSFHQMHHFNARANEAIAGFFLLPVADWVFGTYKRPSDLLLPGTAFEPESLALRPCRLIAWLDKRSISYKHWLDRRFPSWGRVSQRPARAESS